MSLSKVAKTLCSTRLHKPLTCSSNRIRQTLVSTPTQPPIHHHHSSLAWAQTFALAPQQS